MGHQRPAHDLSGMLLVDKPKGCSSHDVVDRARRALGIRKIGHSGTLDPSATGLLILTVGRATRLSRFMTGAPKTYEGTIRFGIATDTYDAAGEIVSRGATEELDEREVRQTMLDMQGPQEQVAPAFSAKKFGGKKGYELARKGKPVPQRTSSIEVYRYEPLGALAEDRIDFRLECSAGTYARSLAHELGATLGCGAHLSRLRRVEVGPLSVEAAIPLAELDQRSEAGPLDDPTELGAAWIPFSEIPLPFPSVALDPQQQTRIANGQTVLLAQSQQEGDVTSLEEGDWIRLHDRVGSPLAIAVVAEAVGARGPKVLQPKIVFN